MMRNEKIYQSILNQLSLVHLDYLQEVDNYLKNLIKIQNRKKQNREKILKLAGAWNDMSEEDFNEFLFITKKVSESWAVPKKIYNGIRYEYDTNRLP